MLKDNLPQTIFLSEYKPSAFLIDRTELRVELYEDHTKVTGQLDLRRNTDPSAPRDKNLQLDAEKMKMLSISLGGKTLKEGKHYHHEDDSLCIYDVADKFSLKTVVEIHPENNTSLSGLYKSRTMFCTQCEAEGFRRITPYIDRPDVMSEFTTTVVADKATYPVLLSNGNPVETRDLDNGRHLVTWQDPFRKPAYLFALVAGDLSHIKDSFTTMSGREIELKLFVEEKDLDKCDHAMQSLKASMKWDEDTYGREYDLDIFMIVAVDDFNMGAMENKGLNIFNTSAVLANPKTTTDARFQWVEGVVAHEYFHNWSGNRVTCRDWFQLSLKEGFTVFRDSEFSADMNSATVKRIENVRMLKAHQFAEDAGPLAHPVQPDSYMEINNFYTLTVYVKGAEIVRMQANLLGPELFRKGTDLYFERHDGQAVTIEDFVACMEEVSGMEMTQFKRWYKQAGTPVLDVQSSYDPENKEYILSFTQTCPPTPESKDKKPFVIPVRMGLIGAAGALDLHCPQASLNGEKEAVLQIKSGSQAFVFEHIDAEPVPSLLRDFSAPVKLKYEYSRKELAELIVKDTDGFNRWDAMQRLVIDEIQKLQSEGLNPISGDLIDIFHELMNDANIDKAMLALMLLLPSIDYLAELEDRIDLDSLWQTREHIREEIANHLQTDFRRLYKDNQVDEDYQPSAEQIARRSLKNIALNYWLFSGDSEALVACEAQFDQADNMTDQSAALSCLVNDNTEAAENKANLALSLFYNQWQNEPLVVNQWFAIQAGASRPGGLARVKALMEHPAFSLKNPNKARAVIAAFCSLNPHNFHAKDGAGYEFIADQVIALNTINPQIASSLVKPLTKWRKMDEGRAAMMLDQLQRIAATDNLSSDVREVVSKSL